VHRMWFYTLLFACLSITAHAQVTPSSDQPTKVDPKDVHRPVPIVTPEAQMPEEARRRNLTGICLISLIVDAYGEPQHPRIVRCTDPIFADNSLAAVMKYKFKPAVTSDGKAVPVMISIEVHFKFSGIQPAGNDEPPTAIRYTFAAPPGANSTGPDVNGVYQLTQSFASPNAPPKMVQFVSKGFGTAALPFPDGVACDVVLTIDAKGKPSDAQVSHCDKPMLENSAIESLLKSKYKPAMLNGKAVPVRATVRLAYAGFGTPKN
jgi:Gram-negative bacterial TonB protein C-terminal